MFSFFEEVIDEGVEFIFFEGSRDDLIGIFRVWSIDGEADAGMFHFALYLCIDSFFGGFWILFEESEDESFYIVDIDSDAEFWGGDGENVAIDEVLFEDEVIEILGPLGDDFGLGYGGDDFYVSCDEEEDDISDDVADVCFLVMVTGIDDVLS